MRPSTAISADGPLNLLNAIRTAIAPQEKGKGVLIVLNDEINSARDATKTNTFASRPFGRRSSAAPLAGRVPSCYLDARESKEAPCRRADCLHRLALYRSHRSR